MEIKVYMGENVVDLGEFELYEIDDVLNLFRAYTIEDENGDLYKFSDIRFDVGLSPHIAVFCKELG